MKTAAKFKFIILTVIITISLAAATSICNYTAIAVTNVKVNGSTIEIQVDDSNTLEIQVCKDNILKVHYLPNGKNSGKNEVVSFDEWKAVNAQIDTSSNPIEIKTSKMLVKVDKDTAKVSVYDTKGNLIIKETDNHRPSDTSLDFQHNSNQNFYGINGYDPWENSNAYILRNHGGLVNSGRSQGVASSPLVWSTSGYGILVNSIDGKFDIDDKNLDFSNSSKNDLEYYVLLGKPTDIMSSVSQISGRSPMFPKWSMGFINTEWGIDENELTDLVNTYRSKKIPIDSFILDFDWKAWGQDNYGEFRWNTDKFPDGPSGRLKKLMDSLGIKLGGIMKPRIGVDTIQGKYASDHNFWYSKPAYTDYFSKKTVNDLDFNKKEAGQWFFDCLKKSIDTGIAAFWNDEADVGFNSLQGLNMEKALYEGQRAYNSQRVWSINRNFYLGAQKYAYGVWSGDINTGFTSMAAQRERMLSDINLGAVNWGMDTGGFNGHPTPENYARWMQFSAFTPIFRVHGQLNEQRQPWVYGETAEKAAADAIRLRYRLLPYIYSYQRKTYETGLGIVRPLIYDYPDDESLKNYVDAWMFGDYLLVSPVVEEGQTTKDIYLPRGTWIDYSRGTKYSGGKEIEYKVNPDTWQDIPLFIKKGAIIPTQDIQNYVGEEPVKSVYVDVFPDTKLTNFQYYDDDGATYNYEKGTYFIQNISTIQAKKEVKVSVSNKIGSFTPALKYYIFKVHGTSAKTADSNNSLLKKYSNINLLKTSNAEGYTTGKDKYGTVTYIKVKSGSSKDILVK